ncbi:MAG: cytidine deaminase [Oscillospiraceae bacterium]|jgi:dCMP deaminase|nr:cytidine deaminase [Oscillospiraceae bacterium]
MQRKDKINYYLDIAQTVSERGTCMMGNSGAIIVKNDRIISTGYTGSPRGRKNCIDTNICMCEDGEVNNCRSVHAEANCIISAAYHEMIGGTMYICTIDSSEGNILDDVHTCCPMCKKLIINAGIDRVIIRTSPTEHKEIIVRDWVFNDDSLNVTAYYK